jgi:hypothetical protein
VEAIWSISGPGDGLGSNHISAQLVWSSIERPGTTEKI